MNSESVISMIRGTFSSPGDKNPGELLQEAAELNRIVEFSENLRNEILAEIRSRGKVDEETITEWEGGTKRYLLFHPLYGEAEIIQNRRRGPGGKYYPYVEIEYPCSLMIFPEGTGKPVEMTAKINLYKEEVLLENFTLPIPHENMLMVLFHCREHSFLLE